MTVTALLARLISRGYIPVSHGPTGYPENWLDLDGKAGSIRVVTHPGDGGRAEVHGLGPRPAGLALFGIRLSGSTPEPVIEAVLDAAETWLDEPDPGQPGGALPSALPPGTPPPACAATAATGHQPANAAQFDLIRGLYADRVIPWPARTSREAFLMERATRGSGQFLTEPDAAHVIDWLLTLPRRR